MIFPISLVDSGAGAGPFAAACARMMPSYNIVVCSHTASYPWGPLDEVSLLKSVSEAIEHCIQAGALVVLLACNTASTLITTLQADFPDVLLLGIIEAAAKLASDDLRIAVLATERTANSGVYEESVSRFNPDATVDIFVVRELIDAIEFGLQDSNPDAMQALVRSECERLKLQDYDAVVLGCSHLLYIEQLFSDHLAGAVHIINSADSAAVEVMRAAEILGVERQPEAGIVRFDLTKESIPLRKAVQRSLQGRDVEIKVVQIDNKEVA